MDLALFHRVISSQCIYIFNLYIYVYIQLNNAYILKARYRSLYTYDLYVSARLNGKFNGIISKKQSSEEAKSHLAKAQEIKTALTLVVFNPSGIVL